MLMTGGTVLLFRQKDKEKNGSRNINYPTDRDEVTTEVRWSDAAFSFAFASLGLNPLKSAIYLERNRNIGNQNAIKPSLFCPFITGSVAGLAASITLYPFDFVRGGVVEPGIKRILSAGSTVPYAATLFGLYFSCRDPNSTSSQVKWAMTASTGAVLAEVPLDYAERTMIGSTRIMLGIGLLYVPFAGFMLVMYDKALIKLLT